MKVIIEAGVFEGARDAEVHGDLLTLFADCRRGRHTITIDPSAMAEYHRWLDGEGSRTRALCETVRKNSLRLRARRSRGREIRIAAVTSPSWSDLRLPIAAALRVLRRPLQLLLENARNDAKFLRVITRLAVDFDLEKLIAEGAVHIQTKGGVDENRVWLETHEHVHEEACRMWVMCDSDARQPWQDASGKPIPGRLSRSVVRLDELCRKYKIPLHILRRRAIDNYVPLDLLKIWSDLRQDKREERHRAFAKLTDEQRYHYNMKEGFQQDEKDKEYAKRVGCLYHGLDPDVQAWLAEGFNTGKFGVADLFDETKLHDGMTTLRVHEKWLRKDKQEDEARRIAEAIQELL